MTKYLKITDGSTTFDLLGNDAGEYFNLEAATWSPAVRSFGSQDTVIEQIPLYASTNLGVDYLVYNLHRLAALIERGRRWKLGENVDPVFVHYSSTSGTLYYIAKIYGPPDGEPAIKLPLSFTDNFYQELIDGGVVLQFVRDGAWIYKNSEIESSASTNNCEVTTIRFGYDIIPSPVKAEISLDNFDVGENFAMPKSLILLGTKSDRVALANASQMAGVFRYTAVSDSANYSRSGTILRYTPNDTNFWSSNNANSIDTDLNDDVRRVAIWVNFRSNISAVTWQVRARAFVATRVSIPATKTTTIIGSDILEPTWTHLGQLETSAKLFAIYLEIAASTTTGSPALDMDVMAVMATDADDERAIELAPIELTIGNNYWEVGIDPQPLSEPAPKVGLRYSSGFDYDGISYSGDGNLMLSGRDGFMVWLATRGGSWRYMYNVSTVVKMTLKITRYPAFLVAQ